MSHTSRALTLLSLFLAALMLFRAPSATLQAQGTDCDLQNGVLIGTLATGVNCLDDAGWHTYEIKSSGVLTVSSLDDVAACTDPNLLLALHVFGISSYDGSAWSDLDVSSDVFAPNALACAPNGDIWVAHTGGISHYNGSDWTTFADDQLGSSPFIIGAKDIAVGANGSVWATTTGSAARYNDGEWQVFENGKGFDSDYSLGDLTLNSDGLPTIVYSDGLLTFNGDNWSAVEAPISGLQTIMVDSQNRTWVGSSTEGAAVLSDGEWTVYDQDSGLSSSKVHALSSDAQGRVWVGTEWGLNVFDGDGWTVYQVANSDLVDNNVQFIRALGDGPALPEPVEKEPGTIIGVIENGRDAVAGAEVELCTESIGGVFYGNSPCEGQPGEMLVTTDENGEFTFEGVPAGRYDVTINGPDGWIYFIGVDTKVIVEPGQTTDLDDIDVSN